MGNPITWILDSLVPDNCYKRKRNAQVINMNRHPSRVYMYGAYHHPRQPHHRDAPLPRPILRHARSQRRMARPPNHGVQGNRPRTPAQNTQNVPPTPVHNNNVQPPMQHFMQYPTFYLPDGSTFVPSYVIPGTMARQTPTGHPFITPAFIPGLLPTSTLSGTLPLPFVTPAFSALPLPTPQIPQQPFAPRVIELSSPLAWPVSGDSSALVWDIWRLPSSAFRRNHRGNFFKLSDGELGAPATTPASDTITIICRVGVVGEFWPTITVRGSPVTIENVLDAIYNHFHAEVTEAEYDEMLGMNRENCSSMLRAMYERCQWSYSLFEDVWRVGIRRLDCLGDMHIFKGLKVEYSSNDSWFLDFQLTTP